jgi:hypothetical protein
VAAFVDDNFQTPALTIAEGSSVEAGAGVDRKAGSYRFSGTVLFHHERRDLPAKAGSLGNQSIDEPGRSDLSFVLSTERRFARERYGVRVFGVANTTEGSGFVRVIGSAELRDNLGLEASLGWFAGEGRDLVGRFADSDFAYLRVKYYF